MHAEAEWGHCAGGGSWRSITCSDLRWHILLREKKGRPWFDLAPV